MRDERLQVGPPSLDHPHQPPHPLFAAGAESRDDPMVAQAHCERIERNPEAPRIDAEARERAARAKNAEGGFERGLRPQRLDRNVHAAPVGEPADLFDRIGSAEVDDVVGAETLRHRDPLGHGFDRR